MVLHRTQNTSTYLFYKRKESVNTRNVELYIGKLCYLLSNWPYNLIQEYQSQHNRKHPYDAKGSIQKFDPINRDARKDEHTGKIAGPIMKVLDEPKRFEKVPNRRKGYTIAMHKLLFQKIQL